MQCRHIRGLILLSHPLRLSQSSFGAQASPRPTKQPNVVELRSPLPIHSESQYKAAHSTLWVLFIVRIHHPVPADFDELPPRGQPAQNKQLSSAVFSSSYTGRTLFLRLLVFHFHGFSMSFLLGLSLLKQFTVLKEKRRVEKRRVEKRRVEKRRVEQRNLS